MLIYALQSYELHLRRTAWQTKKSQPSVRIRFAPVRRNPTASTAALRAKAPARPSNSIVIAGTTGARAISNQLGSFLKKKERRRGASLQFSTFHLAATLRKRVDCKREIHPLFFPSRGSSNIKQAMVSAFSA
jgi:hypothetical protein